MAQRMLIDATRQGETRVVVVSGNRVEEFDYETATKNQLKGNIYLAKVTRVEPSLQAAFVEYGGNRHGFLPFSEIHPDYYRIPIADREALLAEEAEQRAQDVQGEPNGEDDDESEGRAPFQSNGADEDDDEHGGDSSVEEIATENSVDTVGGDEVDEVERRRIQLLRRYKIQEVVKRRQVMLVQVTKEERGNKGAALTTYLSLAGRYCVLMPNTAKGGGISRKISNATDRRRLKSVVSELEIPDGMAVIVRTAGSQRNKTEIRRDYEYLLRLWDDIRNKTLSSTAPCLIHEEANLIKRAIRDVYTRDMENILVEGEEGYKAAKAFMKMLMPSHARKISLYNDPGAPLFHRHQVEEQLEAMYSHTVQLKSGGSIVINPTEALVSIDVNSGRSTRERHIEETALKTNVEAADEVARQLRLRDLAGLVVIDFIDMEDSKHNREVERRLKEAMKNDRARIQLGRISPFGLLELSRQRLRPSLFETVNIACPVCRGTGHLRSPDAVTSTLLRSVTDEAVRRGGGKIEVRMPMEVMLNLFNEKREDLTRIEERFGLQIVAQTDTELGPQDFSLQRLSYDVAGDKSEAARVEQGEVQAAEELETDAEDETEEEHRQQADDEGGRRRRGRRGGRRRRRGEDEGDEAAPQAQDAGETEDSAGEEHPASETRSGEDEESEEQKSRRRRRGRRGGRRRRGRRDGEDGQQQEASAGTTEHAEESDQSTGGQAEEADEQPGEVTAEAAAAETADSEQAAEEKPKPRRRSRRTRKSEAETAAQTEHTSADVAEQEQAGSEDGQTVAEEPPAKPKRTRRKKAAEPAENTPEAEGGEEPAPKKRTRRTRRKSEDTEAPEETAAAEPTGASEEQEVAAETTPAKKSSSRRRSSTRKTTAKKATAESEEAAAPAEAINGSEPAGATTSNGRDEAPAEETASPDASESSGSNGHDRDTAQSDEASGQSPAEQEPAQPQPQKRPRKKGWWNRLLE